MALRRPRGREVMPTTSLFSAVILACLLTGSLRAQNPEGLDFLADLPDFERVREMLPNHLNRLAFSLLEERKRTVSRISTAADVAKRKSYIRECMLSALGGLPERTPLNARVVGVLDRDGYRVEKVIFESQPHFYVTGNLYVPKSGQPPYPAVLFPLGHERGGKPNPDWQHVLVSLARRGFVAFTWDTLGQGERSQFYDTDLETSKLGETGYTTEHTMIGAQRLLVGRQYCSLRLGTASAPWTTCSRGPRWTPLGSRARATREAAHTPLIFQRSTTGSLSLHRRATSLRGNGCSKA